MCFIWCIIAATLLVSLGKPLIMLIAGEEVSETVVKYAYEYILINTSFTLILSMLIVYKSILQSVDKTTWPMISGFTEILGRGGVAVLVVILTSNAVVSESLGFTIVCLANPMAWLFGLLTVLADYIITTAKFKKLVKEQSTN
jgi:Na+-driven multidrug efflux pump